VYFNKVAYGTKLSKDFLFLSDLNRGIIFIAAVMLVFSKQKKMSNVLKLTILQNKCHCLSTSILLKQVDREFDSCIEYQKQMFKVTWLTPTIAFSSDCYSGI